MQINYFEHGLTLSYDSFKNYSRFIDKEIRSKKIQSLKQIDENTDGWEEYEKNLKIQKINFDKKLKFNLTEKIYFKLRRILESRKKNRKNY